MGEAQSVQREDAEEKPLKNNGQISEISGKPNGHCEDEDEAVAEVLLIPDKDPSEEPKEEEAAPEVTISEPPDEPHDDQAHMSEMEAKQNDINEGFKKFFSNIGLKLTVKRGSTDRSEVGRSAADEEPTKLEESPTEKETAEDDEQKPTPEAQDNDSSTYQTLMDVTFEESPEKLEEKSKDEVSPVSEGPKVEEELRPGSPLSPDEKENSTPFKKFFSTGLFSSLKKKKKLPEEEAAEKELVDMRRKKAEESKAIPTEVGGTKEDASAKEEDQNEADIGSSQEMVEASPLKRLLSGSSFKRLSKRQRGRKTSDAKLSDSGEHGSDLQSSTESAGDRKEEPPVVVLVEPSPEPPVEEEGAWASFKKLVTPQKLRRRSEEVSSPTEVAKAAEGEQQMFDQSTDEVRKRKDSSVSWDAVLCGSGKRRSRKTSDSDEDMPQMDHEAHKQESEAPPGDANESEDEGLTWRSFKKLVTPRRRVKEEDEGKDSSQSDVVAQEESSFSIKRLLRKKRKSVERQVTSDEEDSETPAVVPLSEFDESETTEMPGESFSPPAPGSGSELSQGEVAIHVPLPADVHSEVKKIQDVKVASLTGERTDSGTKEEPEEDLDESSKLQLLSDIPEEGTPASGAELVRDDTLADDLGEITSEAITAPDPADFTQAEETEMLSALSQFSGSPKSSGKATPVSSEYVLVSTESLLQQVSESLPVSSDEPISERMVSSVTRQTLGTTAVGQPRLLERHQGLEASSVPMGLEAESIDAVDEFAAAAQNEIALDLNEAVVREIATKVPDEEVDTSEFLVEEVLAVNLLEKSESIEEIILEKDSGPETTETESSVLIVGQPREREDLNDVTTQKQEEFDATSAEGTEEENSRGKDQSLADTEANKTEIVCEEASPDRLDKMEEDFVKVTLKEDILLAKEDKDDRQGDGSETSKQPLSIVPVDQGGATKVQADINEDSLLFKGDSDMQKQIDEQFIEPESKGPQTGVSEAPRTEVIEPDYPTDPDNDFEDKVASLDENLAAGKDSEEPLQTMQHFVGETVQLEGKKIEPDVSQDNLLKTGADQMEEKSPSSDKTTEADSGDTRESAKLLIEEADKVEMPAGQPEVIDDSLPERPGDDDMAEQQLSSELENNTNAAPEDVIALVQDFSQDRAESTEQLSKKGTESHQDIPQVDMLISPEQAAYLESDENIVKALVEGVLSPEGRISNESNSDILKQTTEQDAGEYEEVQSETPKVDLPEALEITETEEAANVELLEGGVLTIEEMVSSTDDNSPVREADRAEEVKGLDDAQTSGDDQEADPCLKKEKSPPQDYQFDEEDFDIPKEGEGVKAAADPCLREKESLPDDLQLDDKDLDKAEITAEPLSEESDEVENEELQADVSDTAEVLQPEQTPQTESDMVREQSLVEEPLSEDSLQMLGIAEEQPKEKSGIAMDLILLEQKDNEEETFSHLEMGEAQSLLEKRVCDEVEMAVADVEEMTVEKAAVAVEETIEQNEDHQEDASHEVREISAETLNYGRRVAEQILCNAQTEQEHSAVEGVQELQKFSAVYISSAEQEPSNAVALEKTTSSLEAPCEDIAHALAEPICETTACAVEDNAEQGWTAELSTNEVQTALTGDAVMMEAAAASLKGIPVEKPDVALHEPLFGVVAGEEEHNWALEATTQLEKPDAQRCSETADTVVMMHMPTVEYEENHRIQVQVKDVDLQLAEHNVDSLLELGVTESTAVIDVCEESIQKVEDFSAAEETEEGVVHEVAEVMFHDVYQEVQGNTELVKPRIVLSFEEVVEQICASAELRELIRRNSTEMQRLEVLEEQRVDWLLNDDSHGHPDKAKARANPGGATSEESIPKELTETKSQVATQSNTLAVPQNTGMMSSVGNLEPPSSLSLEFKLNIQFGQTKALAADALQQEDGAGSRVHAPEEAHPGTGSTGTTEHTPHTATLQDIGVQAVEITQPVEQVETTEREAAEVQAGEAVQPLSPKEKIIFQAKHALSEAKAEQLLKPSGEETDQDEWLDAEEDIFTQESTQKPDESEREDTEGRDQDQAEAQPAATSSTETEGRGSDRETRRVERTFEPESEGEDFSVALEDLEARAEEVDWD